MIRNRRLIIQGIIFLIGFIFLALALNNLIGNLYSTGIGFSFNWLFRPSGFALSEHLLPYSPSDSYLWALLNGWLNSLYVICFGLILSTLLGICVGLARISKNPLIRILSGGYITFIRQTPLLLQLMLWYFVIFLGIKQIIYFPFSNLINISNQGVKLASIIFTPEFCGLLIGLSVFTSAFIAEVIRGGINSVPRGQWEAFRSLGLSEIVGLFKVIIPQSLPVILPGITSQYLNLAKNSTLAIAVGYADIYATSDTIINQTGRAIEGFILLLLGFYILNIVLNSLMETINQRFSYLNKRLYN